MALRGRRAPTHDDGLGGPSYKTSVCNPLLYVLTLACLTLALGCESRAVPPVEELQVSAVAVAADEEPSDDDSNQNDPNQTRPTRPGEAVELQQDPHPFPRRFPIPEFPEGGDWINSSGPLTKKDIRGKFVILDFWTYCCINCMHILPELKKLERAYPNNLVVIGVHSAKFETEKDAQNISEAVLRYEIEHPVVVDSEHKIWNSYGVSSWPTVLLIDPQGNLVGANSGEIKFEDFDRTLKAALPYYRKYNLLNEVPIRFDLLADRQAATPLRFPGKVLADEAGRRLFIADSNHNRIVIATLEGRPMEIIGSGAIGSTDGDFAKASFNHPQGMALSGETLYVADTENHLLRKVDLKNHTVTTIAGVGQQAESAWPGLEKLKRGGEPPLRWVGPPKATALNSPWALWVHQDHLYIAMAGPHQIWRMPIDESEIGPYAGNGREDIVDGALLPQNPYDSGRDPKKTGNPEDRLYSAFAQPSGLTSDGKWLYVADSEGSSIRAVPFDDSAEVWTVIGTADRPFGRLFEFGDVDGPRDKAKLQHALGVVYHQGKIYVADTYNNKIKVVDAQSGAVTTLAGSGQSGDSDDDGTFDEPAGIALAKGKLYVADTNNHLIRTVDISTGEVRTLSFAGLSPPKPPSEIRKPTFPGAAQVKIDRAKVKPQNGKITFRVELTLPAGWKINALAPMSYFAESLDEGGPIYSGDLSAKLVTLPEPEASFNVSLPVSGSGAGRVRISVNYYYCQVGDAGVCKLGSVVFTVPLTVDESAQATAIKLPHRVAD